MTPKLLRHVIRWIEYNLAARTKKYTSITVEKFFLVAYIKTHGNVMTDTAGDIQLRWCMKLYLSDNVVPNFVYDYLKSDIYKEFVVQPKLLEKL